MRVCVVCSDLGANLTGFASDEEALSGASAKKVKMNAQVGVGVRVPSGCTKAACAQVAKKRDARDMDSG
jgi:hypothetical protein